MILAMGFGFVLTYLLGSLNFAVIVSRLLYHDDVRNYGSGNAGMTNMLRTYGKKAAFLTGLGDFFKGTLSVVLARAIIGAAALQLPFWSVLAAAFTGSLETGLPFDGGWVGAIGVLLGHLFPIFFHFKGGKWGPGSLRRHSPDQSRSVCGAVCGVCPHCLHHPDRFAGFGAGGFGLSVPGVHQVPAHRQTADAGCLLCTCLCSTDPLYAPGEHQAPAEWYREKNRPPRKVSFRRSCLEE